MRRLLAVSFCAVAVVTAAVSLSGCDSNGADRVLSVDATGTVAAGAFIDRNGDGVFQTTDALAPGVKISLVWPGGTTPVASGVTTPGGTLLLRDVPVGRYDVVVDDASFGDSLRVTRIDTSVVTVAAGDTARAIVALGYPPASIAAVRQMPVGRKVEVEGIALNGWAAFGDSSVFVQDSTGALRAVRVRPTQLFLGDSVRLVGTVSVLNGQTVLAGVDARVLATGITPPEPIPLSTANAATANGGTLDAALVRITGASILSLRLDTDGNLVATVDDGSGAVDLVIGAHTAIQLQPTFTPGALLDATGLLAPVAGQSTWALHPRTGTDLNATFRSVTIAEARTLPVGRAVQVEGIALNGWATFADSTVHIVDSTGALRMLHVKPVTLFAGDSVRMIGTIAMRDGQVVLTGVTPLVLATGRTVPTPRTITTAVAANASAGVLDAALVHITGAVVQDTMYDAVSGDLGLWVDDGSGQVLVVIDRDLGLALGPYAPGKTLDITGLLIPTAGGATWFLKPRSGADLVVH